MHPIDLDIEIDRRERTHHLFGAQPAAMASGTTRVIAQAMPLEQDRDFGLHLFDRMIVGIAIIEAHHPAHAIGTRLGTPSATGRADA